MRRVSIAKEGPTQLQGCAGTYAQMHSYAERCRSCVKPPFTRTIPRRPDNKHTHTLTHLSLLEVAQGKHAPCQLLAAQARQEVGLVFHRIGRGGQVRCGLARTACTAPLHSCVVPRGDAVEGGLLACQPGVERPKLDPGVAEHVGIGRAPAPDPGDALLYHQGPILGGEGDHMQRDVAQGPAHLWWERGNSGDIGPGARGHMALLRPAPPRAARMASTAAQASHDVSIRCPPPGTAPGPPPRGRTPRCS